MAHHQASHRVSNLPLVEGSRGSVIARKLSPRKQSSLKVSWRGGSASATGIVGDVPHAVGLHHRLTEHEDHEHSVIDHFEISQWPIADPLVSKLKSQLKTESNPAASQFVMHTTAMNACLAGCCRQKTINGIIEGPRVKIKTDICPVDYLSSYKGSIKPGSKAIIGMDGSTTYTFEELNAASDHMASAIKTSVENELKTKFNNLSKESVEYEPCVGLAIEPCEKSVIVILAIWKLGLPYLPIRTSHSPVKRIAKIIETVRPILIIAPLNDKVLAEATKGRCHVESIAELSKAVMGDAKDALKGKRPFNKQEREEFLTIDDLDVFHFRSKRKANRKCYAVFPRFNDKGNAETTYVRTPTIWNRVYAEWRSFPYGRNEVCGLYTSLDSHEFLGQMLAPLLGGQSIAVMNVYDLYTFAERVKKTKIDRLLVFPDLLRALITMMELHREHYKAKQIPSFFDNVEYWFCTGAAMRRDLAVSFFHVASKKSKLVNLFGCKEALSFVCLEVFKSIEDIKHGSYYDILPMGRPVMNTRLYILESDGSVAEQSGLGEIYVTGLGINKMSLSEYKHSFTDVRNHSGPCTLPNIHIAVEEHQKREDENIFMFRTLLKTTDFGRLVQSNQKYGFPFCCTHKVTLEFAGTSESELIIENFRVNVDEIITLLKLYPDVRSCHVMVYRPGTASTVISNDTHVVLAFVVVINYRPSSKEELHIYLRERIPEYMMPTIVIVPGIPVKNFKVDGSLLCERFQRERQMKHGLYGHKFHHNEHRHSQSHSKKSIEHSAAKTMFRIFYHVCGIGEDWTSAHLNWTLAEFHIPFTSIPEILYQLFRHGYYIDMKEMLSVETAKDVLHLMLKNIPVPPSDLPEDKTYEWEIIQEKHWKEILDLYLRGNCSPDYIHSIAHYCEMKTRDVELIIKGVWPLVVDKPHSICIRNKRTKKIVAALLNTDHYTKVNSVQWKKLNEEHPTKYRLQLIDQSDEYLEKLALTHSRDPKNALQVLFFVIDPIFYKTYEDVWQISNTMFSQLLKLAKNAGFFSTYVTLYDYVTANFVEETLNFELIEYQQINMFKAKDLTKPFHLAPDNVIGAVLYKSL